MFREKTKEENVCFEIDGIEIQPENEVKLLGVTKDIKLKYSSHISNLCNKKKPLLSAVKCS